MPFFERTIHEKAANPRAAIHFLDIEQISRNWIVGNIENSSFGPTHIYLSIWEINYVYLQDNLINISGNSK
ncbi:hypothetical protein GE061_015188 [Apolygus lucorum]|uniref:Uncharacterized protein n=1 Tax=Apolygus lucorum TaxID=248454 RepID=A0A8S9XMC2_APOLU|nr:hypothetical protein GE061_015188 [Apolygus lucorum]